jgi:hypothetical protein
VVEEDRSATSRRGGSWGRGGQAGDAGDARVESGDRLPVKEVGEALSGTFIGPVSRWKLSNFGLASPKTDKIYLDPQKVPFSYSGTPCIDLWFYPCIDLASTDNTVIQSQQDVCCTSVRRFGILV